VNHQDTPPPHAVNRTSGKYRFALLGLALGALALATTGGYARAGMRGGVVYEQPTVEVETAPVEVETVPVEIESYPSYAYGGSSVYLVEGRWYRRAGGRWVVYRAEPRQLATVRVSYEARYGRHYRPRPENASPRPRPRHHH
jgi:hypothetical protein